MTKTIADFEILNHGAEHSQYFQGCGVSFTSYTDVATGIGNTPKEAYEDALEMLAQGDWDVEALPKRPRGYGIVNRGRKLGEECWYHVSVRVR